MLEEYEEVEQLFFGQRVRCEQLIPIYMCLSSRPSQALIDAIFEERDVCELLGIPLTVNCIDEAVDILRRDNKIGYLAQFSTPSDGRSWGMYQSKWLYSPDIEALELMALGWACDFHTDSEVSHG